MQQNSTAKLPAIFLKFQNEEHVPKVDKSNITGEDTFNRNYFEIEGY